MAVDVRIRLQLFRRHRSLTSQIPMDAPALPTTPPAQTPAEAEPKPASPAAYLWAVLLARIYAVLPLI